MSRIVPGTIRYIGQTPRVLDVEVITELRAELGEGPFWDERIGRLGWVDIVGKVVHLTDPASGATEDFATPSHVGAVVPRAAGGYLAALQDGFWVLGDGPVRRLAHVADTGTRLRFNDGKCDPAGRLWAGTMSYDHETPAAALYRLDHDGAVTPMLAGVTISNGLAWSGDGSTMFYIDTPTRRIEAFDFDVAAGTISGRRTIVELPADHGHPDGMTIDAADGLWVACWGGGAVRRFVDGVLDVEVLLPVSQPTSCAFGGPDLDELYITSARQNLRPPELVEQPLAGALLRVRPGVCGVPTVAFGVS